MALTREAQVLCFLAGANSIFFGEKLLTTGNPDVSADQTLLRDAGLRAAAVAAMSSDGGATPARRWTPPTWPSYRPWKQPWWRAGPGRRADLRVDGADPRRRDRWAWC